MASQTPPNKTQDRADILESNLYNAISKQQNPVTLQFQIDRETVANDVIVLALDQLFPRLNVKIPRILTLLRRLIAEKVPQGKELKVSKQVLSLADKGPPETAHLGITLRAIATQDRLAVEIKGVPAVPPTDGTIEKAFFDYKSCPGTVKKDGSIDFREINKYPIVTAGDNLFFITPEVQGRPGMQYNGGIIHVPQAKPLTIALNSGVDIVESKTRDNRLQGHFLRASSTGAVLLTKTDGKISGIEIRETLDFKRLDYSVGNIGTQFICPISMKVDTICNDFRIRAKGMVETGQLEGGHVETQSSAVIYSASPGSSVKAEKDITVHFCRGSTLSSLNGYIIIVDESLDTRLDARGIEFDTPKGILSGTRMDAEQIILKNIHICGTNTLYFGRRLFRKRDTLIQERASLKEEDQTRKARKKGIMEDIQDNIKALSRVLKTTPLLRDNLKALVLATQAMDFKRVYQELDTIARTMNTKEVDRIKKQLDLLEKIRQAEEEARVRDQTLVQRTTQAEHDMGKLSLSVQGRMRRASSLSIITPEPTKENPDHPDFFVENQTEKDTLVKILGSYNRSTGFTLTRL
jgi:hypothetical protein